MADKNIEAWLNELPEPEKSKALKNFRNDTQSENHESTFPRLDYAIAFAFKWHLSPEGMDFWIKAHDRAKRGEI